MGDCACTRPAALRQYCCMFFEPYHHHPSIHLQAQTGGVQDVLLIIRQYLYVKSYWEMLLKMWVHLCSCLGFKSGHSHSAVSKGVIQCVCVTSPPLHTQAHWQGSMRSMRLEFEMTLSTVIKRQFTGTLWRICWLLFVKRFSKSASSPQLMEGDRQTEQRRRSAGALNKAVNQKKLLFSDCVTVTL